MVFKSIIGAISVCATLLSFNANAVTLLNYQDDDPAKKIIGVLNLDIDGDLYNMTLHNGSYNSIFPTHSDGFVVSQSFASRASTLLFAFLLDEDIRETFSTNDLLGCGNSSFCMIETVYNTFVDPDIGPRLTWLQGYGVTMSRHTSEEGIAHRDNDPRTGDEAAETNYNDITYASWALAAPVPEPSIAILLGSGLIAFSVVRRKARA